MSNLKNDLDEYLLLQSDQKKTFKMPDIKMPEIKNIFRKKEENPANNWLKDTQESCFPKLVLKTVKIKDFFFI